MGVRMNGKFFDLKKEKQDRMINAALKVFALNGYKHASTDDIVKEASISKGLLFHYFGSKLGLYTFIYDYSVRYMILELKSTVTDKKTDMFELLKQQEHAKVQAMKGYPYMQQFLNRCMYENVSEALFAIEEKRNTLLELYDSIYACADMEQLPPGADGKKLWRMLDLTIKGILTERFLDASFHAQMVQEEIGEYIDMVKELVYGGGVRQ